MPSFLREPLVIIEDALSVDVCEELKYIGTHSENQYGQIGDGGEHVDIRKSGVSWLPRDMKIGDGRELQKDIIWPMVVKTNEEWFGFDLNYHEASQFTTYKAPDEHYNWHADGGPDLYQNINEEEPLFTNDELQVGTYRKLSYVIQLCHPDEYDGGKFQYIDPTRNIAQTDWGLIEETIPFRAMEQGSAIFFSSILHHRVMPVTKGIRHSLVGWVCGPPFK